MKCLKILLPMLKSLTHNWEINASPLYRHIKTKETDKHFVSNIQKTIIQSIYTDEQTDFFKDSPELQTMIKELHLESYLES